MEAHSNRVRDVLLIYINKAGSFEKNEPKLVCITGIFDYLSTAEVKPLLMTPKFAKFRQTVLRKIHEFKHSAYIRKNGHHRLIAAMDEMFTYLVQDDSIPRRRSERQKVRAVRRFNERFQYCSNPECVNTAVTLNQLNQMNTVVTVVPTSSANVVVPTSTANVKPQVSIKVLPRRSARLMKA
jgi:hypothetical protein